MSDSCACRAVSLTKIKTNPAMRKREMIAVEIVTEGICLDCSGDHTMKFLSILPCSIVRERGKQGAVAYMAERFTEAMLDKFGPISFQKLLERQTDQWMQADLVSLAGARPDLVDDEPMGRA